MNTAYSCQQNGFILVKNPVVEMRALLELHKLYWALFLVPCTSGAERERHDTREREIAISLLPACHGGSESRVSMECMRRGTFLITIIAMDGRKVVVVLVEE